MKATANISFPFPLHPDMSLSVSVRKRKEERNGCMHNDTFRGAPVDATAFRKWPSTAGSNPDLTGTHPPAGTTETLEGGSPYTCIKARGIGSREKNLQGMGVMHCTSSSGEGRERIHKNGSGFT